VVVKLMGGVDKRTIPFIITELCLKNVLVKNWSTKVLEKCQVSDINVSSALICIVISS